ncbi:restriction endonuclease subunit S [Candidatus Gracilibacteria bacterium]|nr:restriction endonuclease subunit S [Candidatus Gracilibacteria bacterium]
MRASEKYNLLFNSPISYISLFFTSNFVENKGTTIGDFLMNLQTGKTPPKNNNKYWDSNDFCWYKPEEIGKDIYLYESDYKVSDLAVKEKKVTIFEENTILINCIGDIGRMGILKNKASSNQQITGLLFNENIIPEYFFYYFLPKKDELISKSSSITLPIINQRKLQELEFNLVDIEIQKEFVKYMDYCLECYNKKLIPNSFDFNLPETLFTFSNKVFNIYYGEVNLKLITNKNLSYIKQLKQAILQEAIEGKLTKSWRENNPNIEPASVLLEKIKKEKEELIKQKKLKKQNELKEISSDEIPFKIPENWSWCRLGEIVTILGDGLHGTPEYDLNGEYYFINGNNLTDGLIEIKENTKKVTNNQYLKYKKDLNSNSVLVSINGTIGNVAFYNGEKVILGKSACYFNLHDFISKYYIKNIIKTNYFLSYGFNKATGFTIKNLGLKAMNNLPIPLPPLEEQKEIVKKVDEMMRLCDELEKQSLETKENSENLMKSVLSEVFNG